MAGKVSNQGRSGRAWRVGATLGLVLAAMLARAETAVPEAVPVSTNGAKLGQWTMDLNAARALAEACNLPILLDFSGSDWCGVCQKVERYVFSQPAWQTYARDKLVLVVLDFPHDVSKVPEGFRDRNDKLREQFEVEGYPTFVVLDADGQTPLGQFGIQTPPENGPAGFMRQIGTVLRMRPAELAIVTNRLPADVTERYLRTLAMARAKQKALDEWLSSRPPASDANYARLKGDNEACRDLEQQLGQIEIQALLAPFAGANLAADQALLTRGRNYVDALTELSKAQQELEDWILSRPATNDLNRAAFATMAARLAAVQARLQTLAAAAPKPEAGQPRIDAN